MNEFNIMTDEEILVIDGGCTWCRAGATLMTVGGVVASGCNPVAVALAVPAIIATWVC